MENPVKYVFSSSELKNCNLSSDNVRYKFFNTVDGSLFMRSNNVTRFSKGLFPFLISYFDTFIEM